MAYKILRHPDVRRDLFQIVDLIVEYSGVLVAERKISEIETTIKKLAETPHIGSIRNDLYSGLRAIPTAKKGVITFAVDDDKKTVFIIAIGYAGSNWIDRLPERS